MKRKKILFLTGTRADFGKLKPLMGAVEASENFDCKLFVTGMHMLSRYGSTVDEVRKAGFKNLHTFINQYHNEPMELVLSNTINGLSRYVQEERPDMLVVHGDRVETLAGAIVGALRNILVGHIEGGELSGTVDELIRHSVSKLAHLHFVANEEAANRLFQLGERRRSVFVIGSPDIDVMMSDTLPTIEQVRARYEVPFENYGILLFHPVTTEIDTIAKQAEATVDAVLASKQNFVVIYPNNDSGSEYILNAYEKLRNHKQIKIFPSLRFEYFLTLLKNANVLVGNSSAGIREAPFCGVPTVNIGTRQDKRFSYPSIFDVKATQSDIQAGIEAALQSSVAPASLHFGTGNSLELFMNSLQRDSLWQTSTQKQFRDLGFLGAGL
jgi:UDP-N-acetylglucosamine 2-epimerase (hydrolysing)